ncbi:uncharacterized protein LOC123715775 [Pieris brassicae]|uniref:uncharacterized protein LOC123715775 n=1 Tax=Pieris brassicae TaxID=7116 RepID=UPI001E661EA0|nr:uncharacterized protein LOC123715775 [Pieris brassicae]
MLPTATEKFDKKLLLLVKENPVLYNTNHARYMDCNAREVAWQKIGDELKRPAADCKIRWINIRDVYRRILRQLATNTGLRKKQYKYENEISFLKPFFKDITSFYKYESDQGSDPLNNEEESNDGCDEPIQPKVERKVRKKRRREVPCQDSDDQEDEAPTILTDTSMPTELDASDPVDAFLLSIGTTLKTFSPYHLNVAKSKIFSIVQEHELQQIVQKERSGTSHDIKRISSSDNDINFMQ